MQRYRAALVNYHEAPPRNVQDLWYLEQRADIAEWLRSHGWQIAASTSAELMAHYHRSVPDNVKDAAPSTLFVSGRQP
jgi:O-methyltransferase involved in polyketide biosynthesis